MTSAIVGRWGKNLALRFSNEIANGFELHAGDRVEIESAPDQIIIRRAEPRCTLGDMFAGKSPKEWRALYADACDWGRDLGQEIVDE